MGREAQLAAKRLEVTTDAELRKIRAALLG